MTDRPDVIVLALAALRANHQHHQDYDEHAGYPESELCEQNMKAIAALELQVADARDAAIDYESLFWLAARDYVFFATYNEDIKDWDNCWHTAVNCNDTFYYASADATSLAKGREKEVRVIAEKYGWSGVVAWCSVERNEEPLEQLRTKEYYEAKDYLQSQTSSAALQAGKEKE